MSSPDFSQDFFIRLNEGTESAADEVDRRYREQLCAMVEREMGKRFAAREGPEDPVQSAFRSFYRGIEARRFQIDSSGGLWRLLETITRRKMLKHIEHHAAGVRRPDNEVHPQGDDPQKPTGMSGKYQKPNGEVAWPIIFPGWTWPTWDQW